LRSWGLLGITRTTFYNKPLSKLRGKHGKLKQCASGASLRAQAGAAAGGEARSSDWGDRVIKRFRNLLERKPTYPNHIGRFTPENGASAKGEVGKGSEGIAAGSTSSKTNGLSSCEARHVRCSSPEDRRVSAGKVGKDQAAKEGCVEAFKAASLTRNQDICS
jgi:hypothetical protein